MKRIPQTKSFSDQISPSGALGPNLFPDYDFQYKAAGHKQHDQRNEVRLAEKHLVEECRQNAQHQDKSGNDQQGVSVRLFPQPPVGHEYGQITDQETGPRKVGDGDKIKRVGQHQNTCLLYTSDAADEL